MERSNKSFGNRELFSVVRDNLLEGRSVRVTVEGQSMLPFFRSGSTIVLRPITAEDLRPLNVVLADTHRGFVVHRIIAIDGERVTLLGDGNPKNGEQVSREKIYGVVDCSRLHIALARIWVWMRPMRRWPLAIFRRTMPPKKSQNLKNI